MRPKRRIRISHEHEPIIEEASLADLCFAYFGDEGVGRFGNDFGEGGDHLGFVEGDLGGPEVGVDEAAGDGVGVEGAVGVGEDGEHFGGVGGDDEVPDPV